MSSEGRGRVSLGPWLCDPREWPAGAALMSVWQPPPAGTRQLIHALFLSLLHSQLTGSLSPPWKKM